MGMKIWQRLTNKTTADVVVDCLLCECLLCSIEKPISRPVQCTPLSLARQDRDGGSNSFGVYAASTLDPW